MSPQMEVVFGMLIHQDLLEFIGYPYPSYYRLLFVCSPIFYALRQRLEVLIATVQSTRSMDSGQSMTWVEYVAPPRLFPLIPVQIPSMTAHMEIMWHVFRMHGTTSMCSLISLPDSHGCESLVAYLDHVQYCRLRLTNTLVFRVINSTLGDPELSDDSAPTIEEEEHVHNIFTGDPYISPTPEFHSSRCAPPPSLRRRGPAGEQSHGPLIYACMLEAQVEGAFLLPEEVRLTPFCLHQRAFSRYRGR